MEILASGCSLMRTAWFEQLMAIVGYYGHGSVGSAVTLLLLAHGYIYKNEHTKRAGITLCVALIAAGIATQVLKELIQWPRPKLRASQGFPSGHTSAAFAMASVLTTAFPVRGPLFFLFAVLTAMSRLYFRAHFTWDLAGGAALGLLAGLTTSAKIMRVPFSAHRQMARLAGWTTVAVFGLAVLAFFHAMERNTHFYLVDPGDRRDGAVLAELDFGTAQTRALLRSGWLADEQWFDGKQSVVWATGLSSDAILELPVAQSYRFRLHVFPYSPKGPACQTLEVRLNDNSLSRIFLDQQWRRYELPVPQAHTRAGKNELQFRFNYTDSPKSLEQSSDTRLLSVAFDNVEVLAAR